MNVAQPTPDYSIPLSSIDYVNIERNNQGTILGLVIHLKSGRKVQFAECIGFPEAKLISMYNKLFTELHNHIER